MGSGLPFEVRIPHVLSFRDGKLLRLRLFSSRDNARKSVGLED
jgi:hypothetical protein